MTSFFEDGRTNDADNNHAADNQDRRDESDQEDTSSTGRKFAPDDPIL